MARFTIPPQLARLALVTVVIIGMYFTARYFLVPPSFGQYGWYRGDVLMEYAGLPITYAGAAACADCHEEVVKKKAKAKHAGIACESCHGPATAHVEDPLVMPAKITDRSFCVRCHAASPSRPEKFPQVNVAEHYSGQACMECHSSHQPTEAP